MLTDMLEERENSDDNRMVVNNTMIPVSATTGLPSSSINPSSTESSLMPSLLPLHSLPSTSQHLQPIPPSRVDTSTMTDPIAATRNAHKATVSAGTQCEPTRLSRGTQPARKFRKSRGTSARPPSFNAATQTIPEGVTDKKKEPVPYQPLSEKRGPPTMSVSEDTTFSKLHHGPAILARAQALKQAALSWGEAGAESLPCHTWVWRSQEEDNNRRDVFQAWLQGEQRQGRRDG
jgi:hypothetical protein